MHNRHLWVCLCMGLAPALRACSAHGVSLPFVLAACWHSTALAASFSLRACAGCFLRALTSMLICALLQAGGSDREDTPAAQSVAGAPAGAVSAAADVATRGGGAESAPAAGGKEDSYVHEVELSLESISAAAAVVAAMMEDELQDKP